MKPAVFLDRDGTILELVHYLKDPTGVRLIEGAVQAIKLLERHGYARIVVTNQSAIERGLLDESRLDAIHQEMLRQLQAVGASVNGIYYCPRMPCTEDRETVDYFDRKPGPGMLIRAALDHEISLGQSWMVGDMISDVHAGVHAGCRGSILICSGPMPELSTIGANVHGVANLLDAAQWIVGGFARKKL